MKLSELITELVAILAREGDLPAVYEMYGSLAPIVTEVDGKRVVDVAGH